MEKASYTSKASGTQLGGVGSGGVGGLGGHSGTAAQAGSGGSTTGGAGGGKRDTITGYDEENHIQYSIQQCQIELLRQSSVRSTKEVSRDDLHSRLNYV